MRRTDRYRRELQRQFDWDALKVEAQANPADDLDTIDERVGLAFLGTILSLTPSGKVYTPWATSNLSPCPRCKGTGTVTNKRGDAALYEELSEAVGRARVEAVQQHGAFCEGRWPKKLADELRQRDEAAHAVKPERDCTWCDGLGSQEAAQDKDWHEALEAVAESHGMFVTAGEGDPCDLFVGLPLEE